MKLARVDTSSLAQFNQFFEGGAPAQAQFETDRFDVITFDMNVQHMIRYRIKWATTWCYYFSDNRLMTWAFGQNTRQTKLNTMSKNTVFQLFRSYIELKEKCHIYNFVEQAEFYRLVYDLI